MKGTSKANALPLINNLEESEECKICGEHVICKHIPICEKCVVNL